METAKATLVLYVVDARASRFTVQAFATGLLSAVGHNPTIGVRNFSGSVSFSPEARQGSELRLNIKANSLSVQDDISDKDSREIERIMNEQVLETAKYPEIVYEAPIVSIARMGESLYTAALDGSLTLHGVTRRQPVTARVAVFGTMLRASGDFTLKQTDYEIKLVSVAGGAIKLKDELKFSFEMVAREQE
ncbi:YceI family protein [Tunturibacter empetritectus]|uniref:Polyisoprenoid-binding protein YceI n=1 Tax=Tunturiibacter empetritectus TaxID=3069691 RepID=A0A7W8IGY7_9BACT|nr:YceI family protein [Edaphobacter lichenicola]MBB5316997.1 polyisoprenoid-binding protein YceI [Edaphobacter lichenicola]